MVMNKGRCYSPRPFIPTRLLHKDSEDLILLALCSWVCATKPDLVAGIGRSNLKKLIRLVLWAGVVCSLVATTGCSSLNAWAEKPLNKYQARQWTMGGLDAFKRGRLNVAKNCFTRAMDHNPEDTRIQAHLAETLAEQGEHHAAISHLENAIQRSQKPDPQAHVQLGELYFANGQWIPARRQADLAIQADRKYAEAWLLKGKTEFAKGNWNRALTDFQRALSYQPKNEVIHLKIVDTYQRMGQPMRALATVEELLCRFPADQQPEQALLAKSFALMEMGHHQAAIRVLVDVSSRSDVSPDVFVHLGKAQLLAGQVSQARMTLNRAQQLFPNEKGLDVLIADLQPARRDVASLGSQ